MCGGRGAQLRTEHFVRVTRRCQLVTRPRTAAVNYAVTLPAADADVSQRVHPPRILLLLGSVALSRHARKSISRPTHRCGGALGVERRKGDLGRLASHVDLPGSQRLHGRQRRTRAVLRVRDPNPAAHGPRPDESLRDAAAGHSTRAAWTTSGHSKRSPCHSKPQGRSPHYSDRRAPARADSRQRAPVAPDVHGPGARWQPFELKLLPSHDRVVTVSWSTAVGPRSAPVSAPAIPRPWAQPPTVTARRGANAGSRRLPRSDGCGSSAVVATKKNLPAGNAMPIHGEGQPCRGPRPLNLVYATTRPCEGYRVPRTRRSIRPCRKHHRNWPMVKLSRNRSTRGRGPDNYRGRRGCAPIASDRREVRQPLGRVPVCRRDCGWDDDDGRCDLMTFVLTTPLEPWPVAPGGAGYTSAQRRGGELNRVAPGDWPLPHAFRCPVQPRKSGRWDGGRSPAPLKIVLCAAAKMPAHGAPGFHDYSAWRERWSSCSPWPGREGQSRGSLGPMPNNGRAPMSSRLYYATPAWSGDKAAELMHFWRVGAGWCFSSWSMNANRTWRPLARDLGRAPGGRARVSGTARRISGFSAATKITEASGRQHWWTSY